MCKLGDIILVYHYEDNGIQLGKHSFIVLNDESGEIQGLDYDMVCNVMSSFKSEEHKKKKLQYAENVLIKHNDANITDDYNNNKEGYIKADQLYYFRKDKIQFDVIGCMSDDAFKELISLIESLPVTHDITDNL